MHHFFLTIFLPMGGRGVLYLTLFERRKKILKAVKRRRRKDVRAFVFFSGWWVGIGRRMQSLHAALASPTLLSLGIALEQARVSALA